MSKYYKKINVVEAEKVADLLSWSATNWSLLPQWIRNEYEQSNIIFANNYISIRTPFEVLTANIDDYIVCLKEEGLKCGIVVQKKEYFESNYQEVEEIKTI